MLAAPNDNPPSRNPPVQPVPESGGLDITAQMIAARQRRSRAAVESASGGPPIFTRLTGAGVPGTAVNVAGQFAGKTPQPVPYPGVQDSNPRITYQEILRRIEALDAVIAAWPRPSAGIGHNQPPELIEGVFDENDHQSMLAAIAVLNTESTPTTASPEITDAASTLKKLGDRLSGYLLRSAGFVGKQLGTIVSEAAKSFGAEAGKRLAQSPFWWALAITLINVAHAVTEWLASLQ
jgi:hypothetical protein